MALIGAVVVFLLGSLVGLVLALYVRVAHLANDLAMRGATEAERAEDEAERADAREQERRDHLDATAAIMLEHARLVGAALAAELREQSAQQRNDLRLAVGLPALQVPAARARRRTNPPGARPPGSEAPASVRRGSTALPVGAPVTLGPTRAAPGAWTVGDDEPTPASGWSLEEVRERTEQGAEAAR